MTSQTDNRHDLTHTRQPSSAATALTPGLFLAGVVAGPLYVTTSLVQAFTRTGFDPTRHAWSTLANGDLGWVQRTNLAVTGTLVVLTAVALHRSLRAGRGHRWAPRSLAIFGIGMLIASVFRADPSLGFPPGTPADYRGITGTGAAHMVAASTGFVGAIACCFILASRFAATGHRRRALISRGVGTLFVLSFVGLAATGNQPGVVAFTAAVVTLFAWISSTSWYYRSTAIEIPSRDPER